MAALSGPKRSRLKFALAMTQGKRRSILDLYKRRKAMKIAAKPGDVGFQRIPGHKFRLVASHRKQAEGETSESQEPDDATPLHPDC